MSYWIDGKNKDRLAARCLGSITEMPFNLIASFEAHIDKIRKQKAVWVRIDDTNQWYHTYNKKIINDRIDSMRRTIENLHDG